MTIIETDADTTKKNRPKSKYIQLVNQYASTNCEKFIWADARDEYAWAGATLEGMWNWHDFIEYSSAKITILVLNDEEDEMSGAFVQTDVVNSTGLHVIA